MKKNQLSIIIPIYNAAAYLQECIDSILTQSNNNWELILVDDGSTDNSLEIVNNYTYDDRIKVISQINKGPSAARNRGLSEAKCEYVSFIDADDWVDPNYVDILLNNANTADIVFWGIKKVYELDKIAEAKPSGCDAYTQADLETALYSLLVNPEHTPYFGFTVTKLFRKKIIDEFNLTFNTNLKIKEDEIFTWQYCQHVHSMKILNCAPYNYRILNQSLSHNRKTYGNYLLLAKETVEATQWLNTEILRNQTYNMIFNYITNGVFESINSDIGVVDTYIVIKSTLLPYLKSYKHKLRVPKWAKILRIIPGTNLKVKFIYYYFSNYNKIWKR